VHEKLQLETECVFEALFVKADKQFIANSNNRHAHLTAFLLHLFPLLKICCNVVFGVLNIVFCKKLFRHVAEMAGWGAVNYYVLVHALNFNINNVSLFYHKFYLCG